MPSLRRSTRLSQVTPSSSRCWAVPLASATWKLRITRPGSGLEVLTSVRLSISTRTPPKSRNPSEPSVALSATRYQALSLSGSALPSRMLPSCAVMISSPGSRHAFGALVIRLPGQCDSEPAQIRDEQIGLFHRGEVPAAIELAPLHDVREVPLRETADGKEGVSGEDGDPEWQIAGRIRAWRRTRDRQQARDLKV